MLCKWIFVQQMSNDKLFEPTVFISRALRRKIDMLI